MAAKLDKMPWTYCDKRRANSVAINFVKKHPSRTADVIPIGTGYYVVRVFNSKRKQIGFVSREAS